MRPGTVIAIVLVIAAAVAAGAYMDQLYRSTQDPTVSPPPVVLPAPIVVPTPQVVIHQPPVKIDLAALHKSILRLTRTLMETNYGELCLRAPSPTQRAECLQVIAEEKKMR